ncbi:putative polysaccharide biosynthesis protein [Salinibacillus xinjiangensis]|nr:polysaccharide biosynthesis protein [Salinibacillus xinjiangensis]
MSHKQLLRGALLLTAAGIFGKILSAGYRVPLQNLTGDEGFYIYQQVYPFITIAWILSIYGYPAAISKLVIEQEGGKRSTVTFYLPIFMFIFILNGLFFSILYFGADQLAHWMGDRHLTGPIQFTSVLFLLISFTSFLRGSFQSTGDMRPTAISQTVEQLFRVGFILWFTYVLLQQGKDLYEVGSAAAISSSIGALAAILTLIFSGIMLYRLKEMNVTTKMVAIKKVVKVLFETSLVVGLNFMLLILLQIADVFTMIHGLQQNGLSLLEAKMEKGVFDRGQPLVQLGVVFGSSLSLALVPAISNSKVNEQNKLETKAVKRALKLTAIFSAAATVGLMVLMPSVNLLLYKTESGTLTLQVFSLMILLVSLTLTLSTFLQGLGFMKRQALLFGIAVLIKWLFNQLLIPSIGILGGALASVFSVIFLVLAFGFLLKKYTRVCFGDILPWKSLLLGLIIMAFIVFISQQAYSYWLDIQERFDLMLATIITCGLGALAFFGVLLVTNTFSRSELRQFPYGDRLVRMTVRRRKYWRK